MNDQLTAALEDCLERIDAGTAPAAAIAAHPPALRPALADLVAAAAGVRDLAPSPVRPGFRAALHGELARLEAEARRGWQADAAAGVARDPATQARVPAGAANGLATVAGAVSDRLPGARRARWRRLALSPAAVVALVAVTAFAAGRGLPADAPVAARGALERAWHRLTGPAGDAPAAPAAGRPGPGGPGSPPAGATAVARRGAGVSGLRTPVATAGALPARADAVAPARPEEASPALPPGPPAVAEAPAATGIPAGAAPLAPGPSSAPPERPRDRRDPDPPTPAITPSASAAAPSPTPSPTPIAVAGPYTVTGSVKQLAAAVDPLPLEGVSVALVRVDPDEDCLAGPPGPVARATTAADGGYRFADVPEGVYVVAVERVRDPADPDCRPLRWRTASHLGVAAFCDALPSAIRLDDGLGPARTASNVNVLYAEADRCARPAADP